MWTKNRQFCLLMIPMMKNRFWRKPLLKVFDTLKCESRSSCQLLDMEWPLFVEKGVNLLICKWREAMLLSPRSKSLYKQFKIWTFAVEICRIRIGWLEHSEMCGNWKIFKSTSQMVSGRGNLDAMFSNPITTARKVVNIFKIPPCFRSSMIMKKMSNRWESSFP